MWSGKSSAITFFSRLFDKKKKNTCSAEATLPACRKRSHSMFAPNMEALLAGTDVVGGPTGDKSLLSVPSLGPCEGVSLRAGSVEASSPVTPEPRTEAFREPQVPIPSMATSIMSRHRILCLSGSTDGGHCLSRVEMPSPEDHHELRIPNNRPNLADNGQENPSAVNEDNGERFSDRRATDFSQADNDLRRFLASRQAKVKEIVEEDYKSFQAFNSDLKKLEMPVFHKRIYGSVEALEGEERVQKNRRFRIETTCDNQESTEIPATPVLENPEHQTKWYYKYFLGKLHQNYVGLDGNKFVFVLSIMQERSYGMSQYRAVLWTRSGPKRLSFRDQDNVTLRQVLSKFSYLGKLEKLPREILNPTIQKDLLWLEKQDGSLCFKFGVIYALPGQVMDDELLSNETGSPEFTNFLQLLGDRVRLKGFSKYKGGLDVKGDMTGKHSYYTTFEEHEIMYHVSTELPYCADDRQQVERKRHIGNDIINIIFVDGSPAEMARFKPVFIKSQFTHIYAVVCFQQETSSYHLAVYSEKSVPLYGPSLTSHIGFSDHQEFRRFLLVKCINGEKATYNTQVFSTKRERTYQLLLTDCLEKYGGEDSRPARDKLALQEIIADTGKLHRRKEDGRKDIFVKLGQSLKIENTVSGELGSLQGAIRQGNGLKRTNHMTGGKLQLITRPWDPIIVHTSLQIEVTAGDSWAGVGLLVAAKEGGWILRQDGPPEKVFSVSPVVQLNIMESLGIMVFRTERSGKEQGMVYVYRLSELETSTKILEKEEFKDHGIESSRGCSLYSVSHRDHSGFWMGVCLAKRVLVFNWIHGEEWITFSVDTVDGFKLVRELSFHEPVQVLTFVEMEKTLPQTIKDKRTKITVVAGTKKGFESVEISGGERKELISLDCDPRDAQELWEDDKVELLLTHASTSVFLRETDGRWETTREIYWNCTPKKVIPAFPYCFAFSQDTIEIRSPANGSLLQVLNLPKLNLITNKDDIYFTSTKVINNFRKAGDLEPMTKFCDPLFSVYKISWSLVLGLQLPRSQLNSHAERSNNSSLDSGNQSTDSPCSGDADRMQGLKWESGAEKSLQPVGAMRDADQAVGKPSSEAEPVNITVQTDNGSEKVKSEVDASLSCAGLQIETDQGQLERSLDLKAEAESTL